MSPRALATTFVLTPTQNGAGVSLQAAVGVPMYVYKAEEDLIHSWKYHRSIAVVDAHTHLLSFTRKDGAKITSINTAMNMDFTATENWIRTSACQENFWLGSATSGISDTISGRFCALGGGVLIFCPSGNGEILGAIACSTGTSHQDEADAKAGRDAVLALIRKEKVDEERRVENERQAVLMLWKKMKKKLAR